MQLVLLILTLAGGAFAAEADGLLFSFFRNNGEDGLYLAESADGLTFTELNQGRPLLKPEVGEAKLMRDPSILRGPDGVFHMVWTTAWRGKTVGYASSKDLIHWSAQRAIEVMPNEPNLQNCWAPELFYNQASREYLIVWASTIKDRFPESARTGHGDNNHRLYAMRTRDFRTFSAAKLFYDPGFQVIDGAVFRANGRYAMVAKNETLKPEAKYLFLTFAQSLDGPWTKPSAPVSGKQWAEGPAPIKVGDAWHIYFDKYRDHRYGAIRSTDLEHWEDISSLISFPDGARHGTAFRAPKDIVTRLRGGR